MTTREKPVEDMAPDEALRALVEVFVELDPRNTTAPAGTSLADHPRQAQEGKASDGS